MSRYGSFSSGSGGGLNGASGSGYGHPPQQHYAPGASGGGHQDMYGSSPYVSAPIALMPSDRDGMYSYDDERDDFGSSHAGSPVGLRSPMDDGSLSGSPRGGGGGSGGGGSGGGGGGRESNFKVVIRVRPPVPRELDGIRPFLNVVRVPADHHSITLCEHLDMNDARGGGGGIYSKQTFTFDYVYDQDTKQQDLYQRSAQPAVQSVLQGYNATLMAYGQTGTGKTYTMEGFTSEERRGMIPRCIEEIFTYINSCRQQNMKFLVRASYMQIYNEVISDLLKPASKQLVVRHTQHRGVYVEGLSEWVVCSPNDVYGLMERGTALRATSTTRMSELSSRSHAMFIVIVEVMEGDENNPSSYRFGKLNIVDLAGSEKVRQSGVSGQRLEETKNINRSLHELGNVISALASSKGRKDKHIPFRNSCLTSALRDSLGGNCKTTFIACISPALESYTESLSTLVFANRAKNIKNDAVINEDLDQATLLRKYERELKRLRAQLVERDAAGGMAGLIDPGMISQLEQGKRRAEEDREAALEALEETSRAHNEELLVRKRLEDRIQELEGIVNHGGLKGGPKTSDEYALRLDELDKERQVMEEDKAQVDRYKQLLLKQRDIMLNLTTRLNERDEAILHLQEEIDAYDAHIQLMENAMEAGVGHSGSPAMSRADAQDHLARQRVTSLSGEVRYRADRNPTQLLSAEEKMLELLVQRGAPPDGDHPLAGGPHAAATSVSPSAAGDEVRNLQLILKERVESLVQQELQDRHAQFRRELDALRGRLLASEDARRKLEYMVDTARAQNPSSGDSIQRVKHHIEQEQTALKSSYLARVQALQQELDQEQDQRRHVCRDVDRMQFDLTQLKKVFAGAASPLDASSAHSSIGAQLDRLWKSVQQLEAKLRGELSIRVGAASPERAAAAAAAPARPSPLDAAAAPPDVRVRQLELAVDTLRRQHDGLQGQLEEKERLLRHADHEREMALAAKDRELAAANKALSTHVKDRKALKTILESRIKVKVDHIADLSTAPTVDRQRVHHEARSLQNLVNASITAMDT